MNASIAKGLVKTFTAEAHDRVLAKIREQAVNGYSRLRVYHTHGILVGVGEEQIAHHIIPLLQEKGFEVIKGWSYFDISWENA